MTQKSRICEVAFGSLESFLGFWTPGDFAFIVLFRVVDVLQQRFLGLRCVRQTAAVKVNEPQESAEFNNGSWFWKIRNGLYLFGGRLEAFAVD